MGVNEILEPALKLSIPPPAIRLWHFFLGPMLWTRPTPPPLEDGEREFVPDYRVVREAEVPTSEKSGDAPLSAGSDRDFKGEDVEGLRPEPLVTETAAARSTPLEELERKDEHPIEGLWWEPKNLWIYIRYKIPAALTHGTTSQ